MDGGVGRAVAGGRARGGAKAPSRCELPAGGKSELKRARWWLTATEGDLRESATEKTPPMAAGLAGSTGKGEMVR